MTTIKTRFISLAVACSFAALTLSACSSSQSSAQACQIMGTAGATLFSKMNSVIQKTSADPTNTLKTFEAAADEFRAATKSVTNSKAKEANDVMIKDLDAVISVLKDVDAAARSGNSPNDLHTMVIDQLQPKVTTFQDDWNSKVASACGAR
ncbi:hypothetical protein [Dyella japonica]|uniref:ABC-type transporter MlaC component n=1 Tax=Dyella japonica TaxID=231455 RepID=A0ABV2K1Z1_9GAMM